MKPFYEKDDHTIYNGDCLEVIKTLPDNCIDSILTDPPYSLFFMGKSWDDDIAFNPEVWRECLRVAKPGAMLFAFGGTRTHHRLACAIEDAGWEIRDCITYLHNGDMQQRSFLESLSPEQLGAYMELHHPNKTMQWTYACLSEDTEILTGEGFKVCAESITEDEVLCFDLATNDFHWEKPNDVFIFDYDDIAYSIKSEHTDQIVSRNHRCIVEQGGKLVPELAERLQNIETVPVLESVEPTTGFDWLSLNRMKASITSIHYSGKMWCVNVSTGAFVARRNGQVFVTGNSGFPKSLNIGKSIDSLYYKQREKSLKKELSKLGHKKVSWSNSETIIETITLNIDNQEIMVNRLEGGTFQKPDYLKGTEREVVSKEKKKAFGYEDRPWKHREDANINTATAPATAQARRWSGYFSSMAPSHEPIICAMAPLDKTPWIIDLTPALLDEWEVQLESN